MKRRFKKAAINQPKNIGNDDTHVYLFNHVVQYITSYLYFDSFFSSNVTKKKKKKLQLSPFPTLTIKCCTEIYDTEIYDTEIYNTEIYDDLAQIQIKFFGCFYTEFFQV